MNDEVLSFLKAVFPEWLVQFTILITGCVAFTKFILKPVAPFAGRACNYVMTYSVDNKIPFFFRLLLSLLAFGLPFAIVIQIIEYRWIDFEIRWGKELIFINFARYFGIGVLCGIPTAVLPAWLTSDEKKPFTIFAYSSLYAAVGAVVFLLWKAFRVWIGWDPVLCMSCG